MLEILVNWGNPLRSIAVMLDSIAFNLIDNAYSLIVTFATGSIFKVELIQTVMNNTYVIIGIFALFRIALILVNAMINPDKLNEKGNGIGNVLTNLVIMFVLLIMTPILFRELVTGYTKSDGTEVKSLQQIIVEGNYIQKIFLNLPDKGWSDSSVDPGATMRTIAASSLITIDKEVRDSSNCTGKCEDAVKAYDEMVEKNNFKFSEIAKYVSYQIEVDGEDVYIYNYKMFITFAAGIAITYLLFNFALKLALRMVELTVLEMIAPMFIATYIDPKSAKSGPFSKWLKNVGTTYASLFIDIAIISIMLLFVSLLGNSGGLSKELTGFSKVVMLFAILIFAKKAPKWISDMIGIEGTGFKGIGKTLKEDMLGGSLAAKAARTATSLGIGGAMYAHSLKKANKALQKEKGINAYGRAKKAYKDAGGGIAGAKSYLGTYFSKKGAKQNLKNFGETQLAGIKGVGAGIVEGAKIGFNANDMKDVNAKLKANAKDIKTAAGYKSPGAKVGEYFQKKSDKLVEDVIGSKSAQEIRKKQIADKELAEKMLGTKLYMNSEGDLFYDDKNTEPVAFDTKTIRKKFGGTVNGIEDVIASMVSGSKDSHFVTKDIGAQTYIDSSGHHVTTKPITEGTLVRNMKDANGNDVIDINGNIVKEEVKNSTGSSYNINDNNIKEAITTYTDAAKDKTGKTKCNIKIDGKELNLTGQGVLEYEAAFANMRDENANTWISVNEKKNNIAQQIAELQANYATAQNNLGSLILNTEYGKAESRKFELQKQLDESNSLINEFNSKLSSIEQDILSAQTQLSNNPSTDIVDRLTKFISEKNREIENIKIERSKTEVNNNALANAIIECERIMTDPTNLDEFNKINAESKTKLSAITDRITSLQNESINITTELGTIVSYGNDLIAKVAGVNEKLNISNSERMLSELARQKNKTRENADNYKNDNKSGDNK